MKVFAAVALLSCAFAATSPTCGTSGGTKSDGKTLQTQMVNGVSQCCDLCTSSSDCVEAVLGPGPYPGQAYYPCDLKGDVGKKSPAANHSVISPSGPKPVPPSPSPPPPTPPSPTPPTPPGPAPPIKGKRLVPKDGSVLHCAGQLNDGMTITDKIPYPGNFTGFTGNGANDTCGACDEKCGNCGMCGCYHCCGGFTSYSAYMKPDTRPSMFMAYYAPTWPKENYAPWFQKFKELLGTYDHYFGIQLALWTTGEDDNIVNGKWDEQIDELIKGFKSVGRPWWVRIGYEFNGPWNKHEAEGFKKSWIYITKKIRGDPWCNEHVATVWDYSADAPYPQAEMDYIWKYYPGDEWVDWAAANMFSGCAAPRSKWILDFIDRATQKGLPIMIGESTPRQSAGNWGWYADYFQTIKESTNVRAFCYINWNWFPSNWGDTRIEHSSVGPKYQAMMNDGSYKWFHATSEAETLKRLGLPSAETVAV